MANDLKDPDPYTEAQLRRELLELAGRASFYGEKPSALIEMAEKFRDYILEGGSVETLDYVVRYGNTDAPALASTMVASAKLLDEYIHG